MKRCSTVNRTELVLPHILLQFSCLCKCNLPLSMEKYPKINERLDARSSPCAQRSLHHRAQHGSSPRAQARFSPSRRLLKSVYSLASAASHTLKPALARVLICGGQSEPLFSVICKEKPSLRSAVKNSPLGLVVKNEPLAHGEKSELSLRCEERPRMGPLRLGEFKPFARGFAQEPS